MRNFLIADPVSMSRDLIQADKRFINCMIYWAKHGGQALEFIENHDLDCAIIDLNVPHVNGLEIIDLLQRDVLRPWIIATCHEDYLNSGYPWFEIATSVGANEVLPKPYCLEQLLDRIPTRIFETHKKDIGTLAPGQMSKHDASRTSLTH